MAFVIGFLLLYPVCTHLLLSHGAPVKVKNLNGWSPLAEAISYGDRPTSKCSLICMILARYESCFKIIHKYLVCRSRQSSEEA